MSSNEILVPDVQTGIGGSRLIAFVPILVALLGVAAILLGGISARDPRTNISSVSTTDPMTTGSIALSADQRRALEMLDR